MKQELKSLISSKRLIAEIKDGPRGWLVLLIFAAGLHLVTTMSVFILGKSGLMRSQFNSHGFGAFAWDSYFYSDDIMSLTDKLKTFGPVAWAQAVAPLHIKFYSLSHLPFSYWTSPNVLTIEPLNLFYYLAMLALVYKLAEIAFDRRTGLLAMSVMAVWPSFLMHTTQLIRDPLLIVAILVFILFISNWLTKGRPSFRWSLVAVIPAVLAVLTIWIVRLAMWDAVRVIVALGIVLLIVRHVIEKRVFAGHLLSAIILSVAIVMIPQSQSVKSQQRREVDVGRPMLAERVAQMTLWQRIGKRRKAFSNLKNAQTSSTASNVDNEVEFDTMGDLIRYLPRAAAIGFFAPFPNMWFERGGQVGRTGRLLAGLETLTTYFLEGLALVGLWQHRKNLTAWLLAITAITGVIALGVIVPNIGSLFRFRYPFLMIMLIFAAAGISHLLKTRAGGQRTVDA